MPKRKSKKKVESKPDKPAKFHTRILNFRMTEAEICEFLDDARSKADVRLIADRSFTPEFRSYPYPRDLFADEDRVDSASCLLWNADIQQDLVTQEWDADQSTKGRDVYSVWPYMNDVAEFGSRLYTNGFCSDAFVHWYNSLVRYIKKRTKYYRHTMQWLSSSYVDSLPLGEKQLQDTRAIVFDFTPDDVRKMVRALRKEHDVRLLKDVVDQPPLHEFKLDEIDDASGFASPGHLLLWNASVFPEPELVRNESFDEAGESLGVCWVTTKRNMILLSSSLIRLQYSFRFLKPDEVEDARKIISWYEEVAEWVKSNFEYDKKNSW